MTPQTVAGQRAQLRLQPGGTLNPRKHIYIERSDDRSLLELLLERQYVNILTSRQMGKSSLMVRTAEALIERGVRCAIVDLAAELGTPADAAAYFKGLLHKVARDLKIKLDLEVWWSELGAETVNQRLMRFFREVVCEQDSGTVVVFLDEIDSTLKLPWTDDLFTALRGMYNGRSQVPAYERLSFCLIGVAWPNELIKDRRTTPYNIGRTLELGDFDFERDDLSAIQAVLSGKPENGRRMLERVLYWTGGHPYLTVRLSASLEEIGASTPEDVDARVHEAFRSLARVNNDVHFQQVQRFLQTRLSDSLATFGLYQKILEGARERDQPTLAHTELKLSGLVKRDPEGFLVVRNRIYERLFDLKWVDSSKPSRALRAYRRYAIAAGIALLIAGGYITYLEMRLSEREQLQALNVSITPAEAREGNRAIFPYRAPEEILEQAAPLLRAVDPVTELSFQSTRVSDAASLAALPHLQMLELSGKEVSDVTPLAVLTKLQELYLWDTPISDVAPLATLANLQQLIATGTQVSDVSPLANLANLKVLALQGTQFSDVAPLANLTNLQELSVAGTLVSDVAPLAKLTKLQKLALAGTQVSDVSPLANLANLKVLALQGTQVSDVGPLANLINLQGLALGPQVSDVAPLATLTGLKELDLASTRVSDVSSLAALTRLQKLVLAGTPVSDVAPLAKLMSLRELSLAITRVTDVSPLANLADLQELDLKRTRIWDVSPLVNLANLQKLDLAGTGVSDVAPLAKLTNLQELYLGGTEVSDVAPLANLVNLQKLDLAGTGVSDVAPLANLTNLQELDLGGTRIPREALERLTRVFEARGNRPLDISAP